MTRAKITMRTPRLATLLGKRGGLTEDQAVSAAEEKLEAIRGSGLAAVDDMLGRLQAALAPANQADEAAREQMYRIADSLVGVGAAVGLPALSDAAYSLCELLDGLAEQQRWNAMAVGVHVNSMKLLRAASAAKDAEARRTVLEGLRQATAAALAAPRGGAPTA